jgi:hypothetical protein
MKEVGLVEKVGLEIGNARNSIGITIRDLILEVCRGKHGNSAKNNEFGDDYSGETSRKMVNTAKLSSRMPRRGLFF